MAWFFGSSSLGSGMKMGVLSLTLAACCPGRWVTPRSEPRKYCSSGRRYKVSGLEVEAHADPRGFWGHTSSLWGGCCHAELYLTFSVDELYLVLCRPHTLDHMRNMHGTFMGTIHLSRNLINGSEGAHTYVHG